MSKLTKETLPDIGDEWATDAPTGRGNHAASGPFFTSVRGLSAAAPAGAQAANAATHDDLQPAPKDELTATFQCPLWPGCDCPGGTMRPECPGLKARYGI